ncbi:(2Fe-2S)-binding protein [Halobacterium bonnevillei]|uniref:2Fe-2S iron-sulfur cluster binding domain-containing protein n=1 Tax=Halobacterium bonnevillei TaxID=2692200 RepID=A0A6B0SN04_9EURY|nr:(2Fe-2S)-binding protein [Halobacterium bonnevillei]MXR21886.1 2Fe-2S iron-sulfur cluster binding domain-containing protein [Halobacterium bonnevillei]
MSSESSSQSLARPTEEVTVSVNGEDVTTTVEPRLKLSDFLRDECGKRGVRVGCEHGVCGACTVLVDGRSVKSCLTYAVQVDGSDVVTVEGLASDGDLHPIQDAFHREHALQCGFCTSGFVMATKELLERDPDPDREAIEDGLADNICRCTGYQNIYDAVETAAAELADAERTDGGVSGGADELLHAPSDDLEDRTDGTDGSGGDA